MKAFSILLFLVVAVTLFFVGRYETEHRNTAINAAVQSVNEQLGREDAGTLNSSDRKVFLAKQKQILGAVQKRQVPIPAQAAPAETPAAAVEITAYMPIIVTGGATILSLFLIFGTKDPDNKKWAFATLGTIIGYWLKQ